MNRLRLKLNKTTKYFELNIKLLSYNGEIIRAIHSPENIYAK